MSLKRTWEVIRKWFKTKKVSPNTDEEIEAALDYQGL